MNTHKQLEDSGLVIRNYRKEFINLPNEIISEFITIYGINVEGLTTDDIRFGIVSAYGKFSEKGFNLDNFIKTSIEKGGENISKNNILGSLLTETEKIALGVMVYYFEDQEGILDEEREKFAGDILSNL